MIFQPAVKTMAAALMAASLLAVVAACSGSVTEPETVEIKPDGGWYDSLWVSPDGQMALFMYSRYDFFPAILKGRKPVLEGPELPGHHNNDVNPWDDSDLYFMFRDDDGQWSAPINMPTNDGGSDCCAMIAGDEMFFQKGTDIYIATYEDEEWSAPELLSVSTGSIDSNPHFDWTTQTLYWVTDRGGNMDIWQAKRTGFNDWQEPTPLPGAVNTPAQEEQPYVIGDVMRFSRDGEFGNGISRRVDGEWTRGEAEPLGTNWYHAEVSFSEDGNTVWFTAADIANDKLVFMESRKQEDGSWGKAEIIEPAPGNRPI